MKRTVYQAAVVSALFAIGFLLVDFVLDSWMRASRLLTTSHIILVASGALIVYVSTHRTMESRSQAAAAMQQSHDTLELRVRQRTAELEWSNERLKVEIARRERIEGALREAQETERALMDASPDAAMLIDTSGIVLAANEAAARRVGATDKEYVGSSLFDHFPPDVKERRRAYLDIALQSRQPVHFTDERDGRTLENYVHPVCDAEDNIIRLAVFSQDVTERKQAEAMLEETVERLQFTQAAAGAGSWDWDFATGQLKWSSITFALLGLDEDTTDASLDAWWSVLYVDDRERAGEQIAVALEEHSELASEYRVMLPDGQLRWISVLGKGAYDRENRPARMSGICLDITDRKRAEEASRASEAKFAALFHSSPDVIGIFRAADGVLLDINEAFTKVLGYARSEVVGRSWPQLRHLIPPEKLPELQELLLTHGRVADYELDLATEQGDTATLLFSLTPMTVNGEPCLAAIAHDITRRRQSEMILRQVQVQLAQSTRDRTAQEERQRLARELHDSVSQALYGIALGANTAIKLFDTNRTKVREALSYVLSLAQNGLTEMRALIFDLRPESLKTEGLVAALTHQASALRARGSIEVELSLCDEPDVSILIKEALYRIAQEALNNAAKHAGPGRLDVHLACEGGSLELEVSDDGIGFDPSTAYPGHLGLHSMRERAVSVGGTLDIVSAPGRGTQVRARVPADCIPPEETPAPEAGLD